MSFPLFHSPFPIPCTHLQLTLFYPFFSLFLKSPFPIPVVISISFPFRSLLFSPFCTFHSFSHSFIFPVPVLWSRSR